MAKGQKVLIADHVSDLLSLIDILLRGEGYETATVLMDGPVLEKAKQFGPDAILVDLMKAHADDMTLLDQLRTDPTTRAIPVVAMGTLPDMLEEAVTSYNVKQVLLKPFDIADLEERVHAALDQAPLIAILKPPMVPPKPFFAELATELVARSRAMMIRWVQRVSATEPYRQRQLGLAATIDQVPLLLEAVMLALQARDFIGLFEQHPEIRERAAEHARTRMNQGIPLDAVVLEYQILREEIRRETGEILERKGAATADTLEVMARKDYALDTILRMITETFEREQAGEK